MKPSTAAAPPVVAYIAGYGRSGSTWLARLLGQSPGATAAGELVLCREWLASARDCACGVPIVRCPFWTSVRGALAQTSEGSRFWRTMLESPLVLLFGFSWIPEAQRQRYREHEIALLSSIAAAGEARVVVDSSKTSRLAAGRAAALEAVAGLDVRVLHLVRNPQSVRASLERGTNRELEGRAPPRRWFRRTRAFLGWTAANALAQLLARKMKRRPTRLDFEALCADPLPALRAAAATLDLSPTRMEDVLEGRESVRAEHLAEGNRMRLEPLTTIRATPTHSTRGDKLLGVLLCGITCRQLGISALGTRSGFRA